MTAWNPVGSGRPSETPLPHHCHASQPDGPSFGIIEMRMLSKDELPAMIIRERHSYLCGVFARVAVDLWVRCCTILGLRGYGCTITGGRKVIELLWVTNQV